MLIAIIIVLAIINIILIFKFITTNLAGKAMEIIMKENNIYPSENEIKEAMKKAVFH